jgi:hypothetical protein
VADWAGWELGRAVLAMSALLYAGIWAQMGLYHWAGAFRRWEMVPPVIVTPILVLLILLGVIEREGLLGWLALGALTVGIVEGAAGLYFHVSGVLAQVGGATVRNLMAGPPPVLPPAYALTGVFGLVGLLWNA